MAPKKQRTWSNPPQYEDMSTRQQTALNKQINAAGKRVADTAATAYEKYVGASQDPTNTIDYQMKSASRAGSLQKVMPTLTNRPVTLSGAAERRSDLVERARDEARMRTSLSGAPQEMPGVGWYYTHRQRIMAGAQDVPAERAIAASTVQSPGKRPEVEAEAAHGVINLHTTDPVITEQTRRGRAVHSQRYSEMSTSEVARVASKAAAENDKVARAVRAGKKPPKQTVTTEPEEALSSLASAGLGHRPNVEKSVAIVRGEAEPRGMGGPKIEAYNAGVQHAVPETEVDYRSIGQHFVHQDPNQGMFIFSDPRQVSSEPSSGGSMEVPRESLLSPEHITAEDTWMHAISSNQPMGYRAEKGRMISPAKRVVDKGGPLEFAAIPEQKEIGTHGDPGIDPAGLSYAWHNKATRMAAQSIPVTHSQHGEVVHMPSVMVQEVSWTQGRREAGADAPYNAELRDLGTAMKQRPAPSGQLEMFPERTGARNRIVR